ncbi:MAG: tetratricopeptide repeat protein, partial [Myxococcales bacterium]
NLVDAPPTVEGGWDLIVCRGVLGFFRPSRLARTLGQLQAVLAPTGAIVLGEGEAPPRVRGELSVSGGALTVLRPTRPTGAARAPAPPRRVRPSVARALAVGHARLQEGDPEQALSQFSEALLRDPLCAEAHLLTGLACHRLGDHGSATQALQGALFLSPGLWPAAFYLGLSYDELGDPEPARGAFERLLKTSELRPRRNVLQSPVLAELEGWKPDAVALARKRTRRPPRRTGSTSAAHG